MSDAPADTVWRFTLADLAREADREAALRAHVYGRQVDAGRMAQPLADRRLAMMREIAARLRADAKRERLL
jgi:hypothetical protein